MNDPRLICLTLALAATHLQAATANWVGGAGSYFDPAKWSTNPVVPNSPDYDAVIDGPASSVSLVNDLTLNTLTLNAADAAVNHNGGILQAGQLDIQSGTFNLQYGTLKNTVVTGNASTGQFVFWSTQPTLDNVTFAMDGSLPFDCGVTVYTGLTLANHNLNITAGNSFVFRDKAGLNGTGEVIVNSRPYSVGFRTTLYGADEAGFTLGQNITVRTGTYTGGGANGFIIGDSRGGQNLNTFINKGTISCQTENMSGQILGHWTNLGKIRLSAGDLSLGGYFTPAGLGDFVRTGGTVTMTGQIDASGQPLRLNATTGSWDIKSSGGPLFGRVKNGRIETLDGTQLRVPQSGEAYFEKITLAGRVSMEAGSSLRIESGLDLETAAITVGGGTEFRETILNFTSPTTVGGTGEIVFNGGTYNILQSYFNTGPVTFGPGVTIRSDTGGGIFRAVAGSPFNVQGKLITGPGARAIRFGGPIGIAGTLQIEPGASASIPQLTNFAGGTLTGGTFQIGAGANLRVASGISTNAATILLQGAGANVFTGTTGSSSALVGLTTNAAAGSIQLNDGATLTSLFALANLGNINIGNNSILQVPTLTSSGTVGGIGKLNGTLVNTGHVQPGTVNTPRGTLAISNDLVLKVGSNLDLELAGTTPTTFDRITIGGQFLVSDTLNISLGDGFVPTNGQSFDLFDFGTLQGAFASLQLPTLPAGLEWNTSQLYTAGVINVVPEPAALTGVLGLRHLVLRRRRRA